MHACALACFHPCLPTSMAAVHGLPCLALGPCQGHMCGWMCLVHPLPCAAIRRPRARSATHKSTIRWPTSAPTRRTRSTAPRRSWFTERVVERARACVRRRGSHRARAAGRAAHGLYSKRGGLRASGWRRGSSVVQPGPHERCGLAAGRCGGSDGGPALLQLLRHECAAARMCSVRRLQWHPDNCTTGEVRTAADVAAAPAAFPTHRARRFWLIRHTLSHISLPHFAPFSGP